MTAPRTHGAMIRGALLQTLVSNVLIGALLFVPAGTIGWPQAWIFLVLLDGCGLALGWWLLKADPDLLAERTRSALAADQRPRDRAIMVAILAFFVVWLVLIALDARRFQWSHVPIWLQIVGALLIALAYWGWAGVLRANTFAASRIRLQAERNQTVISSGPYAVVRHPMYAWVLPLLVGASLLLGSYWGLAGALAVLPLLGARALGEEELLLEGLAGYQDYAEKVRFRLLPGIW